MESNKLDEIFFLNHEKLVNEKLMDVRNRIDDVGNSLKSTDNYIEKY